jgi:hypothetical protein
MVRLIDIEYEPMMLLEIIAATPVLFVPGALLQRDVNLEKLLLHIATSNLSK